MNFLLDTNVISELKRGRQAAPPVVHWLASIAPEQVFASVVTLGEIRRGIELVARRDKLRAASLEDWYAFVRRRLGARVLVVDEPVMTIWSKISVPDMLPAYDGLIAATAIAHGLTLVTRNTADFRRAGLPVFNPWLDRPI